MNHNTNYETLLNIEEELKFLTKSTVRIRILNCLKNASYNVKEIAKATNMRYSSVSSNVSKLELNNNIYKEDGKFKITFITRMYLEHILDFNKSLKIITDFEEFWHKHNIDNIDSQSIKNLTDLYNSELVKSTSVDIYKTYNTIKKQIIESENIKAIFPYLHPEYPKLIENQLKNGAKIELLVNNSIYKSLIHNIDDEVRRTNIKNGNFKVRSVKKPLNIYLTICDNNMSLGLYKNDESFDQNRILISSNEKAVSWSENLFNKIKNHI